MANLKLKYNDKIYEAGLVKIRPGCYRAVCGCLRVDIDLYEGKWIGGLFDDDEQEAYWEGNTKKEIVGCVNAYFGG